MFLLHLIRLTSAATSTTASKNLAISVVSLSVFNKHHKDIVAVVGILYTADSHQHDKWHICLYLYAQWCCAIVVTAHQSDMLMQMHRYLNLITLWAVSLTALQNDKCYIFMYNDVYVSYIFTCDEKMHLKALTSKYHIVSCYHCENLYFTCCPQVFTCKQVCIISVIWIIMSTALLCSHSARLNIDKYST